MESDNQTHRAGSLFVLHDELDYPLRSEVSPLPAERINMPFMAFIRGIYEVNRHGWYVPKGSICCYDTGSFIASAVGRAGPRSVSYAMLLRVYIRDRKSSTHDSPTVKNRNRTRSPVLRCRLCPLGAAFCCSTGRASDSCI